jgi:hypothetical protein
VNTNVRGSYKAFSLAMMALVLAGCVAQATSQRAAAPQPTNVVAAKQGDATQAQSQQAPADKPTDALPANYVGKMTVSPAHAPVGSLVTVSATGLPANAKMDLVWTTWKGSWLLKGNALESFMGRKFDLKYVTLKQVTTDASGNATTDFAVPEDYGFTHDINLVQDGVIRSKSAFKTDMEITMTPSGGPAGTPVTLNIKGMGWQALENSWMVIYDNNFTGWLSAVTTAGTARAIIPATGRPGKHQIQIIHGSFTVPYLNGQQSPSPDRPTWAFDFNVTEGDPVLPPPIEQQTLPSRPGAALQAGSGPAVAVSPANGNVSTPLTIDASGLTPGQTIDFIWSTVEGNRVSGNGWAETSKSIGTATVSKDGTAQLKLDTPDDLGGPHKIGVKAGDQLVTATTYTISPSAFALSRASGPVGTEFDVHLKGVGWTETANIYMVNYDNSYLGYVCGFNSGGDVVIPMKAAGEPGWHFIDLYPGVYKGQDMSGTQDFRIPQLTYAQDHPGETLPAFHFAFYVTGQ